MAGDVCLRRAGENAANVNGQNVGGNPARAGRLPPAGGSVAGYGVRGEGISGDLLSATASFYISDVMGGQNRASRHPLDWGSAEARLRGRGVLPLPDMCCYSASWNVTRLGRIYNLTVQQSRTRSVLVVGLPNSISLSTSRVSGASAQAKRGSHQAGGRHSCLVPPTLRHS